MATKTVRPEAATEAARTMAKARWKGVTPEERTEIMKVIGKKGGRPPMGEGKRCFCGESTMWRAALRRFECCRKAGKVVLL